MRSYSARLLSRTLARGVVEFDSGIPAIKSFQFQGSAAICKLLCLLCRHSHTPTTCPPPYSSSPDTADTAHDGCIAGSDAAKNNTCIAFTIAFGFDSMAVPPYGFFYASLTSVQLGAGINLGGGWGIVRCLVRVSMQSSIRFAHAALPCIFVGWCITSEDPLYPVFYSSTIAQATVSFSTMPQTLLDGTPVPMGLVIAGAASLFGFADIAVDVNIQPLLGLAKVSASTNMKLKAVLSLDVAVGGGFSVTDPLASYIYMSAQLSLSVRSALCQLARVCNLPDAVSKMLGSGELKTSFAMSAAIREQNVTIAAMTPYQVAIPAGFYLDMSMNFFDAITARAAMTIPGRNDRGSAFTASCEFDADACTGQSTLLHG